jgi:hypothetical protein
MPIQIMLDPTRDSDLRSVDLLRRISATVHTPWELIALAQNYWLLVSYRRKVGDVVDHPLGEQGGRSDGKSLLPWHQRDHEILGIGRTPADAAALLLRSGKSARLQARQIVDEFHRKHIVFKDLDTNRVLWPDQLGRLFQ